MIHLPVKRPVVVGSGPTKKTQGFKNSDFLESGIVYLPFMPLVENAPQVDTEVIITSRLVEQIIKSITIRL